MEGSDTNTPMKVSSDPQVGVVSPTNSSSCSQVQVVMSPCAACKILRRRCAEKCVLAPYFPPTEPAKFTTAHRVFGASNIIKFLQELPESQRADAVTSMVYEAGARIRDPVYGSAGAICQLQKQVNELQAQLAKAQAELVNMQLQQANLVALICMQMADPNNNNNIHHPTIMQHQREDHEPSSPQQPVDNFIISSPPHAPAGYHHHHQNHNNNNNLNFFFEESTTTSLMNSMWEPLWT